MARLYLTAHPYGVNAIGYQGIDERAHDQIEARGDRMLTHKNSIQRKWHRRAQLVIFGFVVTVFSSCSKSESTDMSFLALLGGGGGGAAPTDPSGPGAGSPGGDNTPPTVLIQNLRDKGIVETGFLIGTAADETGVAAVEVSLDGGPMPRRREPHHGLIRCRQAVRRGVIIASIRLPYEAKTAPAIIPA